MAGMARRGSTKLLDSSRGTQQPTNFRTSRTDNDEDKRAGRNIINVTVGMSGTGQVRACSL